MNTIRTILAASALLLATAGAEAQGNRLQQDDYARYYRNFEAQQAAHDILDKEDIQLCYRRAILYELDHGQHGHDVIYNSTMVRNCDSIFINPQMGAAHVRDMLRARLGLPPLPRVNGVTLSPLLLDLFEEEWRKVQ